MNLAGLILAGLRARPEHTLLTLTDEQGTAANSYHGAELLERAAWWQVRFEQAGRRPGDPVALSPSRTLDLPAMHLGALAAGLAVVPLNPSLSPSEGRRLLASSAPATAATSDAVADRYRDTAESLTIDWIRESEAGRAPVASLEPVPLDGNATALILHTSGTTGHPKSVPLSHANLTANLRALEALWVRGAEDRLLHLLPAHHFHGLVLGIYGSLLAAGALVVMPRFEARAALDAVAGLRPNLIMGVPTMYARILAAARAGDDLACIRLAVSGSAPLDAKLATAFRRRFGIELIDRYGLTECGIIASNPPSAPRPGSVGLPLAATEVHILPGQEESAEGEILVRGPALSAGYGNDPEATARVWKDGFFHTGDLGRLDSDGYLYILGRKKDLIIVGGSNVVPGEVEAVLDKVEGVADLVVAGLPDADLGEVVAAFVVGRAREGDRQADLEARLRAAAAEGLAAYKRPRVYRFVEEIPRNAMGKVDRAALVTGPR